MIPIANETICRSRHTPRGVGQTIEQCKQSQFNPTLGPLVESSSVTTFNERAERWIELALFALLYGLPDATRCVTRAADCLVGYGYHKDMYIYEVLDSVDLLQKAGS